MTVYKEQISLNSHGTTPTYLDITPQVKEAIKNSGIKSGTCTVISPHTTSLFSLKNLYMIIMRQGMNFSRKI